MRLFPMRTFPASGNGYSCLGPVFRPLMDSDQHSFSTHLIELIVSALKTDECSSVKSNDVHNYPGYEYDSGRVSTICMVI